ncbi:hypothetical protein D3C72_1957960 [compost metagenome]
MAEALRLPLLKARNARLGIRIEEDDEIKAILHIVPPIGNRPRQHDHLSGTKILQQQRQAFSAAALGGERRGRG